MADEKDKMAADVEQLEKDMQKAARDMVGTQPGASGRVREALSELQQNEAKLRMKYSAHQHPPRARADTWCRARLPSPRRWTKSPRI